MITTGLKTSFQKLKMEVFKLNDRVHILNMFTGRERLEDEKSSELFELLMNDVLVSINRLTDSNPPPAADTNINGFYSSLTEDSPLEQIALEYQTILNLSQNLRESNAGELIKVDAEKRCRTIKQAKEVACHLKEFTDMLRPHIEYD